MWAIAISAIVYQRATNNILAGYDYATMDTGSTLHVPAKFIITILLLIHALTWCHCFEPGCSNEIPECECESVSGAVSVDCSGRGLTEMPDFNGAQVYRPFWNNNYPAFKFSTFIYTFSLVPKYI